MDVLFGSANPTSRSATAKLIKKGNSLESVVMLPKHEYGEKVALNNNKNEAKNRTVFYSPKRLYF